MAIVRQKLEKIARFTVEISKEKGEKKFGGKCYNFRVALSRLLGKNVVIKQTIFPIVDDQEVYVYTIEVPLKIKEMAGRLIQKTKGGLK